MSTRVKSSIFLSDKNPTSVFLLVGVPVIVAALLLLLIIAIGLLLRRAKINDYCAGTGKTGTS